MPPRSRPAKNSRPIIRPRKPSSSACSTSAQLKAGEKMYDLGSGDGRIVIMAAQKYHADATGIELDDDLFVSSEAKIRQLGLQKTARIIHDDILKQNYSSANSSRSTCCRIPI